MLNVILGVFIALLALFSALTITFIRFFLSRWKHMMAANERRLKRKNSPWAEYENKIKEGNEWFQAQSAECVNIRSFDGLTLMGKYLENPDSRRAVLLIHGYRSDGISDFSHLYRFLYEQGFSLLVTCQRSHGISGGKYITFGVKERFDCKRWAEFLSDRLGIESDIYIHGMSMGASIALMAAGEMLPTNIRGIVADCAYTSPHEIIAHVIKSYTHLPTEPFLKIMSFFTKRIAGFSLKECSTTRALRKCAIPVLFVHGGADRFVPFSMCLENYEACASKKDLLIVRGAGHGLSYLADTEAFQDSLQKFYQKNSKYAGKQTF